MSSVARQAISYKGLLLTVLLAPLSTIPAAMLLQMGWLLVDLPEPKAGLLTLMAGGAIVAVGSLFFAYGFVLLYCVPLYLLLRHRPVTRGDFLLWCAFLPILLHGLFWRTASPLFLGGLVFYALLVGAVFHALASRLLRG